VAFDDSYSGWEDVAVSGDVLSNDTDVELDALTASVLQAPAHGVLVLNLDGSFVYTPVRDWSGVDAFTYAVSDGNGGTAVGRATVTLAAVNDAPVGVDDSVGGLEDTPITGNVLANDTDAETDALTATVVQSPARGVLTLNPDGWFVYTPDPDWSGVDGFTYRLWDGAAASFASVRLSASPVNDLPVPAVHAFRAEAGRLTIDLLQGAWDAEGEPLNVTIVQAPVYGTLTTGPSGELIYEPATWYQGPDSFRYRLTDGTGESEEVVVPITVVAAPPAGSAAAADGVGGFIPPAPASSSSGLNGVPASTGEGTVGGERGTPPAVTKRPAQGTGASDASYSVLGGGGGASPSLGGPSGPEGALDSAGGPAASSGAPPAVSVASVVGPAGSNSAGGPTRGPGSGLTLTVAELSDEAVKAAVPAAEVVRVLNQVGRQIGLTTRSFQVELDAMSEEIVASPEVVAMTVAVGSGMVASVGYVVWTARGSLLLAGFLAATPLWKQVDPLCILEGRRARGKRFFWRWRRDDEHDHDTETLQSLIQRRRTEAGARFRRGGGGE